MTIPSLDATGKVVVVTGGSKGLGRAMALGFAEEIRAMGHRTGAAVTARDDRGPVRQDDRCQPARSAAAKAGLNALTKAAADEFGPRGICVDCIVCGTFHTDSLHRSLPSEALQTEMAARVSLGGIVGAGEIVGTAFYLNSDASSYLTGELILLDGG